MAWYRMICPAGLGARDGPNGDGGVGLPRMPNEDPWRICVAAQFGVPNWRLVICYRFMYVKGVWEWGITRQTILITITFQTMRIWRDVHGFSNIVRQTQMWTSDNISSCRSSLQVTLSQPSSPPRWPNLTCGASAFSYFCMLVACDFRLWSTGTIGNCYPRGLISPRVNGRSMAIIPHPKTLKLPAQNRLKQGTRKSPRANC